MINGVQGGHHEFIWVVLVRKRNWVIKWKEGKNTIVGRLGVGRRKTAVLRVRHWRNGVHAVIVGVHVLRGHHVLTLSVYIVL